MNITLANIPGDLVSLLEQRAESEGRAIEDIIVEVLKSALDGPRRRNLSHLATGWDADPEVEAVLQAQSRIDSEMWA